MLCCIEKSTKIVPTCFRKQVSNRCSKLHQFYNQLGSILGWFWLPFWLQVAPKLLKKSIAKLIKKPMPCCRDFLSTFGRFWHQIGSQLGGTNVCYVGLCWLLEPSWSQDGPWTPPGGPQTSSWTDFRTNLAPTWPPKSTKISPNRYMHMSMYACIHACMMAA